MYTTSVLSRRGRGGEQHTACLLRAHNTPCTENEVTILTLLKPSRNVVQLYGLCLNAWDGRLRLVLELCDYGNVREYVKALPRDKVTAQRSPVITVHKVAVERG